MGKGVHDGHRLRVKEEFLANGFNEKTPAHKMLEMLLFYCLPQGDTNPLAHELIDRYGTIAGVLEAPVDELITFKGLTRNNVGLLKMILPLARQYERDKEDLDHYFFSAEMVGDFLKKRFFGMTEERLALLFLDSDGRYRAFSFIAEGDIGSVGVSTRKIIEITLKSGASCAVMAHNHPNGLAIPSSADIEITRQIREALATINVRLTDHYILTATDYVSMRESREYRSVFVSSSASAK